MSIVASSGNGFMNTSSSCAPRAVTPHGNDHVADAVVLHGAVARPRDPVISCSTAISPPSTSTMAPASGDWTISCRRTLRRLCAGSWTTRVTGGGRGASAVVVVGAVVVVVGAAVVLVWAASGGGAGATSPISAVTVAERARSVGFASRSTWSPMPPVSALPPAQNHVEESVGSGRAAGMATPASTSAAPRGGSSPSAAWMTRPPTMRPASTTSALSRADAWRSGDGGGPAISDDLRGSAALPTG
jgi:hypothetical protein